MLRRVPSWAIIGAIAVLVPLLLTACADAQDNPMTTIDSAGAANDEILSIYSLIWWLAVVVFVLVQGALLYVIFRYRGRSRPNGERPAPVHGNTRLEIIWTIIPAVILVIIAVPTLRGIVTLSEREEGPDVFEVRVIAQQFFWQFEYLDVLDEEGNPVVTSGTLNVPVGQRVELILVSNDVIHSFWVPRLAGKTDNIPGRENHMWFVADEADTYRGQCAEFCGAAHALMSFEVEAMEDGDFSAWADSVTQPEEDLAEQGLNIIETACASCHMVEGTSAQGTVGPALDGFANQDMIAGVLENNEENLREWLADPPAVKPGTAMPDLGLSEQQIDALVEYLYTLE